MVVKLIFTKIDNFILMLLNCKTPFTRYSRLSNRLYNRFDNRLYRVNKHPTGCQTGCQTNQLDVCLHDTAGCQTDCSHCTTALTTGCIV